GLAPHGIEGTARGRDRIGNVIGGCDGNMRPDFLIVRVDRGHRRAVGAGTPLAVNVEFVSFGHEFLPRRGSASLVWERSRRASFAEVGKLSTVDHLRLNARRIP